MNIKVIKGDITRLDVDAIVNAANNTLLGGGGVDGAIHKAAGNELLEECRLLNGCNTGDAKYTKGYRLVAKYIIHTVGPVWQGGNSNEPELLASCYYRSLELAKSLDIKAIAFPNISTGVFGFPKIQAAEIALKTVKQFLQANPFLPIEITFVCFDDENYDLYHQLLG
ncbi:O-acetyl-ADP-ribose deacetylase [Williamwhitmania taraxaci]|uniref:O-acetyl-ADP-ribose deacetylase (Regulator of RNase III), contains Macro domain n=1 Tax=Williamwhitmania taraxaci TaxID=1640674 RepID=A0A1G6LIY5_9BACT|nr:O-acetyl-ADP-ribose deacetylase [Williamwhitmania taraxaci]SDC43352.1 O-acetyl-ADP-ribose deacetylase (regulator of RNase III), contains Macro domain [Williamwhitmania taraxaci]